MRAAIISDTTRLYTVDTAANVCGDPDATGFYIVENCPVNGLDFLPTWYATAEAARAGILAELGIEPGGDIAADDLAAFLAQEEAFDASPAGRASIAHETDFFACEAGAAEAAHRLEALRDRRAARGAADPLAVLRAAVSTAIANGAEPIVEIRAAK